MSKIRPAATTVAVPADGGPELALVRLSGQWPVVNHPLHHQR